MMTGKQKVVLVECGSFNPITNMHLRMFEIARDHLHRMGQHEVVGGIISPVNDAYCKKDLITANHRIEMIKLALKSSDWIKLDTWETEQNIWSETAIVLNHLQSVVDSIFINNESPKNKKPKLEVDVKCESCNQLKSVQSSPVTVKLLCGADLLESFGKPGLWKEEQLIEIIGKYGIVVVTREGSNPYKFIYESDLLSRLESNITIVTEWITNDVSSTKIRRAVRRGESVKYLLQDSIIQYINKLNLFKCNDNKYIYGLLTPSPNADNGMMYPSMLDENAIITSHNGQFLAPPPTNSLPHPVPNSLPIIPPPMQYRQSGATMALVHHSFDHSKQINHEVNHVDSQLSQIRTYDHETTV